jgi:hypothetical protein
VLTLPKALTVIPGASVWAKLFRFLRLLLLTVLELEVTAYYAHTVRAAIPTRAHACAVPDLVCFSAKVCMGTAALRSVNHESEANTIRSIPMDRLKLASEQRHKPAGGPVDAVRLVFSQRRV